ncbi:MAG: polyprenol monophosphomannose synthase [Candidatus Bathyarchaeota archaeon]
MKLSIIIPTYNEAENIPQLFHRIQTSLKKIDHEIIVVDDSSQDGTPHIAEKRGAKVLERPAKRGIITAFQEGFKISTGEVIGLLDADLQHPPERLSYMLHMIEKGSDLVIASRYVSGGGVEKWGLKRRLISRVAILLSHFLLSKTRKVKDVTSGYFMARREVIESISFSAHGWKVLPEILVKGRYRKICELPFTFKGREKGESKLEQSIMKQYWSQLTSLRHGTT